MGLQRVGHSGATFSLCQQIEYPSKGSWLHRVRSVCDDTSRGLEHLTHNADAQCHLPKPPRGPFDFSATAAVCSLSRLSGHAAWRVSPHRHSEASYITVFDADRCAFACRSREATLISRL